jgi:PTH1 family peptidyl-tRNA hydrolase
MTACGRVKMITGLGNPGREYAATRHNVGFRVIDLLATDLRTDVNKRKFGGRFGECEYKGCKVMLLKPWQFMNRSGDAVSAAAGFYKLALRDVLVVLDDMWLEPGATRMRARGSAGGHKGLLDIIDKLGSDRFPRLRIGIGKSDTVDAVDYVLGAPDKVQSKLIEQAIVRAKDAVLHWIEYGVDDTMSKFNRLEDNADV